MIKGLSTQAEQPREGQGVLCNDLALCAVKTTVSR